MRFINFSLFVIFLFVSPTLALAADPPRISWRVLNNFRVIDGDDKQRLFEADIEKRRICETSGRCAGMTPGRKTKTRCRYGNFCTVFNPQTLEYPKGWYANARRSVSLTIRPERKDLKCHWYTTPLDGGVDAQRQSVGWTTPARTSLTLGKHRIEAECEGGKTGKAETVSADIELKDIKIVAMGDSFMSGEGSPHTYRGNTLISEPKQSPAQWLEHRCHSSLFSSTGLAAADLAERDRHQSVTYVNLACSGAELLDGILTDYEGRVRPDQIMAIYKDYGGAKLATGYFKKPKIKPQIDQLKALACDGTACVPPDYLFVLTGGNELKFAKVMEAFVSGCDADCRREKEKDIKTNLANLDTSYQRFHDEVENKLGKHLLSNIVLLQYPNPMQDERARPCFDSFFKTNAFFRAYGPWVGASINSTASKFAVDQFLTPLNNRLACYAAKFGWRHVQSIQYGSRKNGYCAARRWFNTLQDSDAKQNNVPKIRDADFIVPTFTGLPTGAMHPNFIGHYNMAAEVKRCFQVDGHVAADKNQPKGKDATCPRATAPETNKSCAF